MLGCSVASSCSDWMPEYVTPAKVRGVEASVVTVVGVMS